MVKPPTAPRFANPLLWVLLLAVLAHLPVLRNGFVDWDDDRYVLGNPRIQSISLANIKDILDPRFTPGEPFPEYQPIRDLSYLIEYALWGAQPLGYQLTSLLLHACNALALYLFFVALAGRRIALWVALLFACNPVHVESVAWIASRKDQLGMLFSSLSGLAFLHWRKTRDRRLYVAALAAFVGALLSKSQAVILPLVLGAVLLWSAPGRKQFWANLRSLSVFFGIAVVYVGWFLWLQFSRASVAEYYEMGFAPHPAAILKTFAMFAQVILLPFNLSPYHDLNAVIARIDMWFWLSLGWLAGFVWLVVRTWRRGHVGLALLLFALQLLPVLNLLPHPVWIAERYTYFAAPFLYWALVEGAIAVAPPAKTWRYAAWAVLLIFTCLTWRQIQVWHDPVSFSQAIVKRYPDSLRGRQFLAESYLKAGLVEASVAVYEQILIERPQEQGARLNLAGIYYRSHRENLALPLLQSFLQSDPGSAIGAAMLGKVHMRLGEYAAALPHLEAAARSMPKSADAHFDWGLCLAQLNRLAEAETIWLRTLQLDAQHLETLRNLTILYAKQGNKTQTDFYAAKYRELGQRGVSKP